MKKWETQEKPILKKIIRTPSLLYHPLQLHQRVNLENTDEDTLFYGPEFIIRSKDNAKNIKLCSEKVFCFMIKSHVFLFIFS